MPKGIEAAVGVPKRKGFFFQFQNALAPFGQWLQSPQWGLVWQPQVGPGWQPYTVGRWLDDPNYGRTWLGDEPWSWATDHYGRWGYDNQLGWMWVPGTQWAPAWVAAMTSASRP